MAISVRDHRTQAARPTVRDHRTADAGGGGVTTVRDHRTQAPSRPVVRDHRTDSMAPMPRPPTVMVAPPPRPPLPRPPIPLLPAVLSPALLNASFPSVATAGFGGGTVNSLLGEISARAGTTQASVEANMPPGLREMYEQLKADDPVKAKGMILQMIQENLKWMNELVSNVTKGRSEMGMTTARNLR